MKKYSYVITILFAIIFNGCMSAIDINNAKILREQKEYYAREAKKEQTEAQSYGLTVIQYRQQKERLKQKALKEKEDKEIKRLSQYEINYLNEYKKISKNISKYNEAYIQPNNKKEPCKIYMGYSGNDKYFEEDSWKVFWDGQCKNGFAHGLGREIEKADMVDKWQIAIYKKGKAKGYLIQKDILNNVLYEGIYDNNILYSVQTNIKEKLDDIEVITVAGKSSNQNRLVSISSPFWNGTYRYLKEYPNFRYVYVDYRNNDMATNVKTEFFLSDKNGDKNGWAIAELTKQGLITGKFKNNKFIKFKLPQIYNDKANDIIKEISKAQQKAYHAQEKAQLVKKQYKRKICKKKIKVSFMDNDEYKKICSNASDIIVLKKIQNKLEKLSKDKIAKLEQQRFKNQQQKEEQHRQQMLSLERQKIQQQQAHYNQQQRNYQQKRNDDAWDSLNKQIRDMTPKTYNVNMYHY
jgi:hypothetical protein